MENSSRLGSEDQWRPASILEVENVGRKGNFGSTRKGIKEHEQSEKCLKEEINSNRKINNQILGAEKEVESGDWGWLLSAVQTAEIQLDRGDQLLPLTRGPHGAWAHTSAAVTARAVRH